MVGRLFGVDCRGLARVAKVRLLDWIPRRPPTQWFVRVGNMAQCEMFLSV